MGVLTENRRQVVAVVVIFLILIALLAISYILIRNEEKINLECTDYPIDQCPTYCVVCPPCEVCSSISCQTKDFCESIGFNETWYSQIQDVLETN